LVGEKGKPMGSVSFFQGNNSIFDRFFIKERSGISKTGSLIATAFFVRLLTGRTDTVRNQREMCLTSVA
jgi:hypothetical protein